MRRRYGKRRGSVGRRGVRRGRGYGRRGRMRSKSRAPRPGRIGYRL